MPSELDTCLAACSDKSCHFEQVALVSTDSRHDLNLPQNNSSLTSSVALMLEGYRTGECVVLQERRSASRTAGSGSGVCA